MSVVPPIKKEASWRLGCLGGDGTCPVGTPALLLVVHCDSDARASGLLLLPRCGTPARRDPATARASTIRSGASETRRSVAPRSVPWLSLAIETSVDRLG